MTRTTVLLAPLLLSLGCATGESPATATGETSPPPTFQAQVSRGQQLFAASCARCHGASGEGTQRAPRLVGLSQGALPLEPRPGARLRHTEFRTVADVADFVVHNMPADAPGSLPAEQYWDILAFALKANGLDVGPERLDEARARTLQIPR